MARALIPRSSVVYSLHRLLLLRAFVLSDWDTELQCACTSWWIKGEERKEQAETKSCTLWRAYGLLKVKSREKTCRLLELLTSFVVHLLYRNSFSSSAQSLYRLFPTGYSMFFLQIIFFLLNSFVYFFFFYTSGFY